MVAVGIHIHYVSPHSPLPEETSMTMYIRHRGDSIPEQVLPFGEDVKDEIRITMHSFISVSHVCSCPNKALHNIHEILKMHPHKEKQSVEMITLAS